MSEREDLEVQATRFAEELTQTVSAIAPGCAPFKALAVKGGLRFAVRQDPADGIPLSVNNEPLIRLKVDYWCCLDGVGKHMAIEKSKIAVHAGSSEPLFRYEYVRDANQIPAAHLQLHAHRDALTALMVRAGKGTKRGARRADSTGVQAISELHFPVGGLRFRPSLEDILEMLIDEFGVDGAVKAKEGLADSRMRWRRTQTKAAVRDDPESAIEVLESLGYDVTLPPGQPEPPVRFARLRQR